MAKTAEMAEVFWTALKALPRSEQDAVVVRIARDRQYARDILDLVTIEKRRGEPARSCRSYLAKRKKTSA